MDRITPAEYATAVTACVALAQYPTGGGRVAAQVLLSAYNGDSFQLDITSLCNLDNENYAHALDVIRGRYEVGQEPQQMIPMAAVYFGHCGRNGRG